MKLVTLKANNSVLCFCKHKLKNYVIPLLHVQLK